MVIFALFQLSSLICGVANSSTMLIVGRAIARIGTAGLYNGTFIIIAGCVPMAKRPNIIGYCNGYCKPWPGYGTLDWRSTNRIHDVEMVLLHQSPLWWPCCGNASICSHSRPNHQAPIHVGSLYNPYKTRSPRIFHSLLPLPFNFCSLYNTGVLNSLGAVLRSLGSFAAPAAHSSFFWPGNTIKAMR